MHAVVLKAPPAEITVGESISWEWSDSRFPADAWSLVYTLLNASHQIQITATTSGDAHLVEVLATSSADYNAGDYAYQAHVSNGSGERYVVAEGSITIAADFATQTKLETRSFVKQVLDAIESALLKRASKTQLKQDVDGVSIEHMTHDQLMAAREIYARKYRKELARQRGQASRKTIGPRFCNSTGGRY